MVTKEQLLADLASIRAKMDQIRAAPVKTEREHAMLRALGRDHQAVQERIGAMTRAEKAERQQSIERAFMDAAMRVLTTDQVKKVWNKAHELNPWLTQKDSVLGGQVQRVYEPFRKKERTH